MTDLLILNEIKTDLGVYQKRSDGILVFRINPKIETMSVDDLSDQLKIFCELQDGKPSPFMMVTKEIKSLEDSEKRFIKENVGKFSTAAAMVTDAPLTNFLFNIFIYLYRPPVPSKLFNNEKDAVAWLKTF